MKKEEMTVSERFQAVMQFKPFDRMPMIEWATWWDKTISRWHSEKLPSTLIETNEISSHFGLDLYKQKWLSHLNPGITTDVEHGIGLLPGIDPNNEYREYRKDILPLGKRGLNNKDIGLFKQWQKEKDMGKTAIWFTLEGFFWFPRILIGIENHLYSFYDYPELLHKINSDLADWHIKIIESICKICKPDFMTFAEDMSYNLGMMISENQFNEFMLPYYKKVIPVLEVNGIISFIDSDGDITQGLSWFKKAGLQGILPLERQAGVDLNVLREIDPSMCFIGHFDKMIMDKGFSALIAEFERLLPLVKQGGYIISVDHQTPPNVSYDQYLDYLKLLREYAWLSAR